MADRRKWFALLLFCGALLLAGTAWALSGEAYSSLPEATLTQLAVNKGSGDVSLLQQPPMQCSVTITTTDRAPTGNHNLNNPETLPALANYSGQSLLAQSPAYPGQLVDTRSDFYRLDNAQIDYRYTVSALPALTTNYDLGLILYDRTLTAVLTDSNPFAGNSASITFVATNTGPYFFEVFQRSDNCTGGTYSLALSAATPTPLPATATPTATPGPGTPTPLPTLRPGFDQFEPNYNFDTAAVIAPGVSYRLNFIPYGHPPGDDNDFFKLWVKPGLVFTCETFDLDPGVDTNMILYDANREVIAGNDDRALGDYSSKVSYYSTYEGFLYVLVGHGGRIPLENTDDSEYSLRCEMQVPGAVLTLTPPPSKDTTPVATATPRTTSPVATPTLTPRPEGEGEGTVVLSVRPMVTPPPLQPTPTPSGFRTFRLVIYYDTNLDGQFGAGEGVPGFFARILDASSGAELARGYTDEQGQLSFSVPTVGTVRVLVPLLGVDRYVDSATSEVKVRIVPAELPEVIP